MGSDSVLSKPTPPSTGRVTSLKVHSLLLSQVNDRPSVNLSGDLDFVIAEKLEEVLLTQFLTLRLYDSHSELLSDRCLCLTGLTFSRGLKKSLSLFAAYKNCS